MIARFIATASLISATLAGGAQAPKQASNLDAKAKPVMDQVAAAYRGLNALHERISTTEKGPADMLGQVPEAMELKYRKPNRVWLSMTEKRPDGKRIKSLLVCDGTWLWRWSDDTNAYRKEKAPAALKAIPQGPNDSPEMELLFRDKEPLADFTPEDSVFTLAQPQKVGELPVDVVETKISPKDVPVTATFRLFVAQSDHLFRAVEFAGNGTNPTDNKPIDFTIRLTYDLVDAAPTFTTADFAFVPPPGSKPAQPVNPKPQTRSLTPPKSVKKK